MTVFKSFLTQHIIIVIWKRKRERFLVMLYNRICTLAILLCISAVKQRKGTAQWILKMENTLRKKNSHQTGCKITEKSRELPIQTKLSFLFEKIQSSLLCTISFSLSSPFSLHLKDWKKNLQKGHHHQASGDKRKRIKTIPQGIHEILFRFGKVFLSISSSCMR